MPAETHSHREDVDTDAVVAFVATVVGIDDDPGEATLDALDLDDDLAQLRMWSLVVEEFGERQLGDFEPGEHRPVTVRDLAEAFCDGL